MTSSDLILQARSNTVKEIAKSLGFMDCRISKAQRLDQEAKQLEQWLKQGLHGEMRYMENRFEKRLDPRLLVPGTKSVIVLSYNYYPSKHQQEDAPHISKYAYGKDYHKVIWQKLNDFLPRINEKLGKVHGRGFADSAPVMEKAWATRSGIGWMGKHTNVLSKKKGSFFFLAVLMVDIELAEDHAQKDHCGQCTACIDACPTEAIVAPYMLNASRCISYFTIELRDRQLPDAFKGKFNNWMFGCDICQDVCPWNRFSKPHHEPAFQPKDELLSMDRREWENLEMETFELLFAESAVKRAGFENLKRNIHFLTVD